MVDVLLLLISCVRGQLTFGRRAALAFGSEERGEALDGGGGGVLAMMVVDAVGDDAGQGGGGGGHDSGSCGRHGSCRNNGFVQPRYEGDADFDWGGQGPANMPTDMSAHTCLDKCLHR